MPEHNDPQRTYSALRQLTVQDPKRARQEFCELLDGEKDFLVSVLEAASAPGEGRVRQLIANAVRSRPDKDKLVVYLLQWHQNETDEFAKRAIDAALDGIDRGAYKPEKHKTLVDPALVGTYRYVTGRIRHQMNNALLGPAELVMRLSDRVASIANCTVRSDLESLVAELDDAFKSVGRIVAFGPDDDFFVMRSVVILDWLNNMNLEYGRKYRPINLSLVDESPTKELRIRANDYWLHTIFWNLWTNAQQAVAGSCEIKIRARKTGSSVQLTVLDNGDGFHREMREIAFQEKYSSKENYPSKGSGRGRGLLEIQDAVEQLLGSVQLVEIEGRYRVRIRFPLEEI